MIIIFKVDCLFCVFFCLFCFVLFFGLARLYWLFDSCLNVVIFFLFSEYPEPTTVILGGSEMHIDIGSTINLTCVIQHTPEPPDHVFWTHNQQVSLYLFDWFGLIGFIIIDPDFLCLFVVVFGTISYWLIQFFTESEAVTVSSTATLSSGNYRIQLLFIFQLHEKKSLRSIRYK